MPKGRSLRGAGQIIPDDQRLTDKDRPKFLAGRAAEIWAENLPRLHWLTKTDAPLFATWCQLFAEFEADPPAMQTARLAQLRLLSGDLGLTGSGRASLGVSTTPPSEADDPAAKYLR